MKRAVILLLVALLSVSMISAAYKCSGDIKIIEDIGSMNTGETDIINGLHVGLSMARDIGPLEKMEAELLIDARKYTVRNENGTQFNFTEIKKTIKLINLTSEHADIKVDSTAKQITKNDIYAVGGIQVMMADFQGVYPGTGSIDVLAGISKILLSNTDNPGEIIELEDISYAVELYSASDGDAMITVKKCENPNSTIVKVADTINQTNPINNSNQSNNQNNSNITNNTNLTGNQNNNSNQNDTEQDNKPISYSDNLVKYAFIALIVIIIIVVIAFIIRYNKYKKYQTNE